MSQRIAIRLLCSIVLLGAGLVGSAGTAAAQAFSGTSSLIRIPVAAVQDDGTVTAGASYMGRRHAEYREGEDDLLFYYAAITYLPFAEVGLRFAIPRNAGPQALGDRSMIARVQVLREGTHRPALLMGAHDFLSSTSGADSHFAAFYLVATKHVRLPLAAGPVGLHAGYGAKPFEAVYYDYAGPFGGVEWPVLSFVDLLAEYDGETVSLGTRLDLFGYVELMAALQGGDTFTGGAAVHLQLP